METGQQSMCECTRMHVGTHMVVHGCTCVLRNSTGRKNDLKEERSATS